MVGQLRHFEGVQPRMAFSNARRHDDRPTPIATRTPGRTLAVARFTLFTLLAAGLLSQGAEAQISRPMAADVVLKGGTLVDGTGSPARRADVAIRGARIVAVGDITPAPGAKVIDV